MSEKMSEDDLFMLFPNLLDIRQRKDEAGFVEK